MKKDDAGAVGLPVRMMLYTLDQVAFIIDMDLRAMSGSYIYFVGRSTDAGRRHYISARNIAKPDDKPDWRVAEAELIRWMKLKGFRFKQGARLVD